MALIIKKQARIPIFGILTIGILPSLLKVLFYRLNGAKIGKNVSIGFGSIINAEKIEIGDNTKIGFLSIIKARSVKIGENVKIGATCFMDTEQIEIDSGSDFHEQVFVGGISTPKSILKIGKRVTIFQFTFLNPTLPLTIEDDVGIGGRCSIFTHSSRQSILEGYPVKFAPVTIKKNVWLPWNVFILPGVTIGEGATIGAGSLVNKDIPPSSLAVGMPAKVIRNAGEYPQKITLETKSLILGEILDEFADHLRYFGIAVDKSQQEMGIRFSVRFQKKTLIGSTTITQSIFVPLCSDAPTLLMGHDDVVLTFKPQNEVMPQYWDKMMWLDIDGRKISGPSCELGEELTKFLTRYGIRFV